MGNPFCPETATQISQVNRLPPVGPNAYTSLPQNRRCADQNGAACRGLEMSYAEDFIFWDPYEGEVSTSPGFRGSGFCVGKEWTPAQWSGSCAPTVQHPQVHINSALRTVVQMTECAGETIGYSSIMLQPRHLQWLSCLSSV